MRLLAPHTFESLHYRDYRLLWLATLSFVAGYRLQLIVLGWFTYDLTRSPLLTALVVSLDMVPYLVLGPVAGLAGDAWDRRKLLGFSFGILTPMVVGLGLLVTFDLVQPWHLFVFSFLSGVFYITAEPAMMALIPNLVPQRSLVNAFALNNLAVNSAALVAPAAGGVLIGLIGPSGALFIQAALALATCLSALAISAALPHRPPIRLGSLFPELRRGVVFALRAPTILPLLLLIALLQLLLYPYVHNLMPVYAEEVLFVGPEGLGLLLSAIAAGAIVGNMAQASLGSISGRGSVVLGSLVVVGLAAVGFSRSDLFGLSLGSLMVLGAAETIFHTTTLSIIQRTTPDNFRGRVGGMMNMMEGFSPVGSLFSGALAQRYSAPLATLVAGIIAVVSTLLFALRFRKLS
jgi:MFS family permease